MGVTISVSVSAGDNRSVTVSMNSAVIETVPESVQV